jgi:predicted glutamine amidotransferase
MCGIIGFNGKNPDVNILKIIALYNDTRGGDGCGYVIDNKVHKYADFSHDTFTKLFSKEKGSDFKITSKKNQTILMHTRKASVGGSITENCHPFWVGEEKGELIGVHNGTIRNIDDLALKYLPDNILLDIKKNSTDSEILFKIINHTRKADVLTEYDGGAALAWYDPKEPTKLYLFKGASKSSTHYNYVSYSEKEVEERPLFYAYSNEKKEGIYFSSLMEPLIAVGLTDIYTVSNNTLMVFESGQLVKSYEIKKTATPYRRPVEIVTHSSSNNNSRRAGEHMVQKALPISTDAKAEGLIYLDNYKYYIGDQIADGVYAGWEDNNLHYGWKVEGWDQLVSSYKASEKPSVFFDELKASYGNSSEYFFFYNGVLISNTLPMYLKGYVINSGVSRLITDLAIEDNLGAFKDLNTFKLSKYTNEVVITDHAAYLASIPVRKQYSDKLTLVGTSIGIVGSGKVAYYNDTVFRNAYLKKYKPTTPVFGDKIVITDEAFAFSKDLTTGDKYKVLYVWKKDHVNNTFTVGIKNDIDVEVYVEYPKQARLAEDAPGDDESPFEADCSECGGIGFSELEYHCTKCNKEVDSVKKNYSVLPTSNTPLPGEWCIITETYVAAEQNGKLKENTPYKIEEVEEMQAGIPTIRVVGKDGKKYFFDYPEEVRLIEMIEKIKKINMEYTNQKLAELIAKSEAIKKEIEELQTDVMPDNVVETLTDVYTTLNNVCLELNELTEKEAA